MTDQAKVGAPHRTSDANAFELKPMKDHVYELIELTGTSTTSIEDAVSKALKLAHKTIKNLGWFQVTETRVSIDKGKVQHSQAGVKTPWWSAR